MSSTSILGRLYVLLFAPPAAVGMANTIAWWEIRRVPVNLILGTYGLICLTIFLVSILTSSALQPGEDAVEPMAILVVPILFNICYTSGWVIEILARRMYPAVGTGVGPLLLKIGLIFSIGIMTLPSLFWGVYRGLELLHILR